jgi:hypothetical protein
MFVGLRWRGESLMRDEEECLGEVRRETVDEDGTPPALIPFEGGTPQIALGAV